MGAESSNWHLELTYDHWVALSVSGPRPSARYKHATAVVDEKLYLSGGSRNGRYLSDVQVFNLKNLAWSTLKLSTESNADETKDSVSQEILPATSGHSMFKWGNKLLLVGGHSKNIFDSVTVRFIDLESYHCGIVETSGKVPVARGGQSLTLVGSRLIMFGGEDRLRRLLNDVHVLDLETMVWDVLETTQTPPAPRFDHTAAVNAERYLLIFGGCSHSIFFNDVHVLDLQTVSVYSFEISFCSYQHELLAVKHLSHDVCYFFFFGCSIRLAEECILFLFNRFLFWSFGFISDLSALLPCHMHAYMIHFNIKFIHVHWTQGLSVSSVLLDGEKILIAFGGYNGKYNNEVYVMRPKPSDSPHPKIFQSPAAAAAAASVTAAYALTTSGKLDLSETEDSIIKVVQANGSQRDLSIEVNTVREEKKVLESALEEVRAENSSLKGKIDETTSTYTDFFKELQSVQGQLVAERSRCAKLEAQIAELQKMLESLPSIEEEVQLLRRQKSAFERDMELASTVQGKSSGGVWKWIAG
ncbi:acyl-CoA-binding domain-containing protein 4-like [Camellia sinensis]|uniref:acyl-CoA-binding domain-containing protein 4-like n=1 Tax=Camellia sinensis TaxID=4442 RepID=UPI001035EB27|nr:acyl-CoA-binding domain-containing protein 4-like [Camellia sinensis]